MNASLSLAMTHSPRLFYFSVKLKSQGWSGLAGTHFNNHPHLSSPQSTTCTLCVSMYTTVMVEYRKTESYSGNNTPVII